MYDVSMIEYMNMLELHHANPRWSWAFVWIFSWCHVSLVEGVNRGAVVFDVEISHAPCGIHSRQAPWLGPNLRLAQGVPSSNDVALQIKCQSWDSVSFEIVYVAFLNFLSKLIWQAWGSWLPHSMRHVAQQQSGAKRFYSMLPLFQILSSSCLQALPRHHLHPEFLWIPSRCHLCDCCICCLPFV